MIQKRIIDVAVSLPLIVALAPVLLIVALAVLICQGRPVLFQQWRAGRKAIPFRLLKYRTMRESTDTSGRLLPDVERLTPVGRILRKFSIDELPQLWNVLLGHMSLIGPRPLLMQYVSRYTPEQARRHEVRPGITGWAQVNGRNALTWEEKFRLDVWYVDHVSLALDVKILAMTFWRVLTGAGVSAKGEATMPEFMGTATETEVENRA